MSTEVKQQYRHFLRERRSGVESTTTSAVDINDVKPEFYADARLLIDGVTAVYEEMLEDHPPYGLVDKSGQTIESLRDQSRPWLRLENALSATAHMAFKKTTPPVSGCPYKAGLQNLVSRPLPPIDNDEQGLDRLREVIVPGALFAPATVVNLVRRIPAMARAHSAKGSLEQLAHGSRTSLLNEPLGHPQQYSKAFTFCLAEGVNGQDLGFQRDSFLSDELISAYTQLGQNNRGEERIEWSMPTAEFALLATVRVANRTLGPEDAEGEHTSTYPPGTKLKDIAVDEPTIGCPGNQLAYVMWNQATNVAVSEELWQQA